MKYNVFLDDERTLEMGFYCTHDTDFLKLDWDIVRSYDEFVNLIYKRYNDDMSFPSLISFDHDLADAHYEFQSKDIPYDDLDEKTGYHCAKWLVDFCMDNDLELPNFKVHSQNTVGKENIIGLLNNFRKFKARN